VQQINIATNEYNKLAKARDYAQSRIAYDGRTGIWPTSGGGPTGNTGGNQNDAAARTGVLGVQLGR